MDLDHPNDTIEASGLTFDGVLTNAPHGMLYCQNAVVALDLALQNTWYQVTAFTNAGGSPLDITESPANDDLTTIRIVRWLILCQISFSGSVSETYEFQIQKNNGTVVFPQAQTTRRLGAGGDVGSCSIVTEILVAADTDTLELWARCTTAAAKSVTVKDCQFLAIAIAED